MGAKLPKTTVLLREVDGNIVLTIPPKVLAALGIGAGDSVCFTQSKTGIELSKAERDLDRAIRAAHDFMDHYRATMGTHSKH
jgi:bifunctional DNA-binding transcriptional regulator/antitoxin component of YhaV-PrlF toxin-antitoxin module